MQNPMSPQQIRKHLDTTGITVEVFVPAFEYYMPMSKSAVYNLLSQVNQDTVIEAVLAQDGVLFIG